MPNRDFSTDTWTDPWFESLKPHQKLLFIYCWTNSHCPPSGMYYITVKRISDETGLGQAEVRSLLPTLDPKVCYDENFNLLWIRNFVRKQKRGNRFITSVLSYLQKIKPHRFLKAFSEEYKDFDGLTELHLKYNELQEKFTCSTGIFPSTPGAGAGAGEDLKDQKEKNKDQTEEEKEKDGLEGKEKEGDPQVGGNGTERAANPDWPREFVNLFNSKVEYIPKVSELSSSRREKINTRKKEKADLAWWARVFEKADNVLIPGKEGKKDWFPTFDWLIDNDKNAVKVFEGNYDNARRPPPKFTPQPGMDAWLREKQQATERQHDT